MTAPDRPWLVQGAQVAVLTILGGKPAGYQIRTVDRFTSTQVVLDDDGRWRLTDLRPVGDSNRSEWARYSHVLAPLDDPRLVQLRVSARLRSLGRVVEPWLNGKRTNTDVAGAMELLDQVQRAVTDTRARIAALDTPKEASRGRNDHAE